MLDLATAVGAGTLVVRRTRRLSPLEYRHLTPAVVGLGLAGLAGVVAASVENAVPTQRAWGLGVSAQRVALLGFPLTVGVAAWRRRAVATHLNELTTMLARPVTAFSVRDALREFLADATLDVLYRTGDPTVFADGAGSPVPAAALDGRLAVPVTTWSGQTLAVVSIDARLTSLEDFGVAASTTAGFVMEKSQLPAQLRAGLGGGRALARADRQRPARRGERISSELAHSLQQPLLGLAAQAQATRSHTGGQRQRRAGWTSTARRRVETSLPRRSSGLLGSMARENPRSSRRTSPATVRVETTKTLNRAAAAPRARQTAGRQPTAVRALLAAPLGAGAAGADAAHAAPAA